MNNLKVTMLLALLTGILVAAGGAIGRESGMIIAFAIAIVMNAVSYWYSDKIVLAMYGAREVSPQEAPGLHRVVAELAMTAQIPKPRVFVTPEPAPNAFATGRDPQHGVVAVTEGLLAALNEYELKGVLAHELGHIKNRDTLIQCMAAAIGGAVTMLANMAHWALIFGGGRSDDDDSPLAMIVMIFLAPLAAMLVQLAISRTREYQADAAAARFTHNPLGLASALAKLEAASQHRHMRGNPAAAHMFIVNPLRSGFISSLFSTHPPIQERIRRLQEMRNY